MKKTSDKKRIKKLAYGAFILAALLIIIGGAGLSCVQGLTPIGWSGGAVVGDNLFVGSQEGRLVDVNLTDESRQWSEQLQSSSSGSLFGCLPTTGGCSSSSGVAIYGTPAVGEELVYIGGYNGKVYAFARDTLMLRWVFPREGYGEAIVGGLIVADGRIYYGDSGGVVWSLDAATGDLLWIAETEDKIWGTPTYADGVLYIGSFDKKLYAINADDGSPIWDFETEGTLSAAPLVIDGTIYFGGHDRYFYALGLDGQEKWRFQGTNWFWTSPAVYDGKLYAGCLDGKVYVLDMATGNLLSEIDLEDPLASTPVIYEDSIIFCTKEGKLVSISTDQYAVRELAVLEELVYGPLAIADGIVYVNTQDLLLRRVNASTGAVLGSIDLSRPE